MALHVLTERDVRDIRTLLAAFRGRPSNTVRGASDQIDHEEFPAPEVYVAITPAGGIPGRSGLTPGTKLCDIYNVLSGPVLSSVPNFNHLVHNLSSEAIPGEVYVPVIRDKYGVWLALNTGDEGGEPGTGTGTGQGFSGPPCDLAALREGDCVIVHTGVVDYTLTHDGTGWTSSDTFTYPAGTGVFLLQWNSSTGLLDLLLGGMRLMNCGNSCYTGGPLTGHVLDLGTGADDVACNGFTFTVCIECTACIGTGTGTSGTGTGGYSDLCGRYLAALLVATVSGGEGTISLYWNSGNARYEGSKALTCGETLWLRYDPAGTGSLTYSCNGADWLSSHGGLKDCGPPFSDSGLTVDMDDTAAGCVAGSCGALTVDVSE